MFPDDHRAHRQYPRHGLHPEGRSLGHFQHWQDYAHLAYRQGTPTVDVSMVRWVSKSPPVRVSARSLLRRGQFTLSVPSMAVLFRLQSIRRCAALRRGQRGQPLYFPLKQGAKWGVSFRHAAGSQVGISSQDWHYLGFTGDPGELNFYHFFWPDFEMVGGRWPRTVVWASEP